MARGWIGIAGLLFLCACGGSGSSQTAAATPVSPSPPPSGPRVCGTFQPCTLSGIVRAGGGPVGGAKVALVKFDTNALLAGVVTDQDGAYRFASAESVSFSGALVSVVMPGYATETKYIPMSGDQTLDFALERAEDIPFGNSTRHRAGEARCASLGYGGMGGATCRRLAVTVPASGTLAVTLTPVPASAFDISVLRPDGTIGLYGYTNGAPVAVTLRVEAGLTYQIDVVDVTPASREFELTTAWR
jgi:hypothetical protein